LELSATAAALPTSAEARATAYARPLLFFLAALPCVLAVVQLGRLHPDELFQTLEPALYRARGYGVLAWEWRDGIRNWSVPLLFSLLIRLCDLVGIRDPQAIRAVISIPQLALHLWMLRSVFRYAQRRAGAQGALWATLLVAIYPPILAFAGRTLSESFSAPPLVIALERLDRSEQPAGNGFFAGVWMGLAVVTRYGSAVFAGALLIWLLAARRWRQVPTLLAGLALVAAGLGVLDWATWGRPFHSFIAYLQFNLLSGGAELHFGSSPASYYVLPLIEMTPIWVWPTIVALLLRRRLRIPAWLFLAAVYLAALFWTPHKEQRFLYPALVLLLYGTAPEVVRLAQKLQSRLLRASALMALCLLTVATAYFRTEFKPLRGDQFRATVAVARDPELTGLVIVNEGLWGSGGFFYIGKPIPWLTCDWPSDQSFQMGMRNPVFNRAITYDGRALQELQAAGFKPVSQMNRATILARSAR